MSLVELNPHRLPREVAPRVYHLVLQPDLDAATFQGSVVIDCDVVASTHKIVLNALDLEVNDARIVLSDGRALATTIDYDRANERVILSASEPLRPGGIGVEMTFTGTLNDLLRGFYKSTFADAAGKTHVIATTQMEAADARRAFPCFDEPDRKASFEITLVVPEGMMAVSNQPVLTDTPTPSQPGWRRVVFSPTMVMSTYLVAFIVGPLAATEPIVVTGVPIRVIATADKIGLADYALEWAGHALRHFNEYFDIPYPGDKIDLVGVPDFAYGAMENLGAITFREATMLIDATQGSLPELQRVAVIVCHEMAHMWFGDLVTMSWWEGLWLNESFANLMETLGVDAYRPEWEVWATRGWGRKQAMSVDGLHATRPIESACGPASDADGMVDRLTYEKGGGVLRTLEQFLGPEVFRDGIRRYLRAHLYANTVTKDLWDALSEESGIDVAGFMNGWILQGGHPVVWVNDGVVTQEPFTYGPTTDAPSAIGSGWTVPLLYRGTKERSSRRHLLDGEPFALPPSDGPVILNARGWGVYRVGYGAAELAALASDIDALDPLERANLTVDLWELALSGRRDLGTLMTIAGNLGDDLNPTAFGFLASAFTTLTRVCPDAARHALQGAIAAVFGPRFERLGFDPKKGESDLIALTRATTLHALGVLAKDRAIRDGVLARFDTAYGGGAPLDANLAATMLAIVGDVNRPGDYQRIKDRYENPTTPQDKVRHLVALMNFADVNACRRSFDLCMTEVRTQDAPFMIARLIANPAGGPSAWGWVEENWGRIMERFPSLNHDRMLETIPDLCGHPEVAERVVAFLKAHPIPSSQRSVDQAMERLVVNTAFGQRLAGGHEMTSALARLNTEG